MYHRKKTQPHSHSVFTRSLRKASLIRGFQSVINLDIKISLVGGIRLVGQSSLHRLALLDSQYFSQVEHCLFPMRVFRMWACGEANRLVACCEIDIEPCDEGVDEIVSLAA